MPTVKTAATGDSIGNTYRPAAGVVDSLERNTTDEDSYG
jgi:hypothetical protein